MCLPGLGPEYPRSTSPVGISWRSDRLTAAVSGRYGRRRSLHRHRHLPPQGLVQSILIYFRLIAKQVITAYINPFWPLITDGIHKKNLTRFESREKPDLCLICWALTTEASGTNFIMSLMWHSRRSNPQPPAHEANTLPQSHRWYFPLKHLVFQKIPINNWILSFCLGIIESDVNSIW